MMMECREDIYPIHLFIALVEISPRWLHSYDLFFVSTVISALIIPLLCLRLSSKYMSPIEESKNYISVLMVILITGIAAVFMNFSSVIHGWVWNSSSSLYKAALILSF